MRTRLPRWLSLLEYRNQQCNFSAASMTAQVHEKNGITKQKGAISDATRESFCSVSTPSAAQKQSGRLIRAHGLPQQSALAVAFALQPIFATVAGHVHGQ